MRRKLAFVPASALMLLGLLAAQVPAFADSSATPSVAPNPGASDVANAYASVSPDTGALAINTTSGSSVFALAFDIKFITGDTVSPTNLAIAYSSCTSCQAVAVSIQVVIYENGAHTVAPANAALAINNACTLCDTMASAYQLVIGESGPVRLTGKGMRQIAEIRQQLVALQSQKGLTGAQIQDQVSALVAQLLQVLQTQLVPIKDAEGEHNGGSGDGRSGSITLISPSPTTRPYSPPPASPKASPSPSASAVNVSPTP
ncbi:MAG: putative peptide zinc metalloprotease protein [Chloroflexota bacterium]|jgi:hypothetical protein|nr:putative peptide zinc metalloprotease protein [Chloroflexota bacterium]